MSKLFSLLLVALLTGAHTAGACTVCRPKVQAAIHNQHYAANALLMLLPVLLLIGGGLLLYFSPSFPSLYWKPTLLRPAAPTVLR